MRHNTHSCSLPDIICILQHEHAKYMLLTKKQITATQQPTYFLMLEVTRLKQKNLHISVYDEATRLKQKIGNKKKKIIKQSIRINSLLQKYFHHIYLSCSRTK